jgi:hypothetical protein
VKEYDPVLVRWIDSGLFISDGWQQLTEVIGQATGSNMTVTTIGHLIHEDDEIVVVGLSLDKDNDAVFGAQTIAKMNIIEYRSLSV